MSYNVTDSAKTDKNQQVISMQWRATVYESLTQRQWNHNELHFEWFIHWEIMKQKLEKGDFVLTFEWMKKSIENGNGDSFSFKWQVVEAVLWHFFHDIKLYKLG